MGCVERVGDCESVLWERKQVLGLKKAEKRTAAPRTLAQFFSELVVLPGGSCSIHQSGVLVVVPGAYTQHIPRHDTTASSATQITLEHRPNQRVCQAYQ